MVLNMPNLGSKISFMSKRKNSWNDKKSNQESLMITSQGGRSTLLSSHDNRIVTALFNYNNLCDLFVVSVTRIETRNPKSRQLTFLTPPASTACSLWKTTWKLTRTRLFNKQAKEAIIDIALFLFSFWQCLHEVVSCSQLLLISLLDLKFLERYFLCWYEAPEKDLSRYQASRWKASCQRSSDRPLEMLANEINGNVSSLRQTPLWDRHLSKTDTSLWQTPL